MFEPLTGESRNLWMEPDSLGLGAHGPQPPPVRVLIIDDDPTTVEFFELMLVAEGYVVCTALTCEAGLAEAAIRPPGAILLDLHLPLMDGLECLRRLRANPLHVMTPVAILTGDYFVDQDVALELQELGARIHFKPVWDGDLQQIVEGLMSQHAGLVP
jgi:DNA-binding response OmpR family regulator